MFEFHNRYTKLTYGLLGLNSVSALVHLGTTLFAGGHPGSPSIGMVIFLIAMLLLNSVLVFGVYKRSTAALKLSLIFYLLQIFGFVTANWQLDVSFGMLITVALALDNVKILINLFAVVVSFIIFKGLRAINHTSD